MSQDTEQAVVVVEPPKKPFWEESRNVIIVCITLVVLAAIAGVVVVAFVSTARYREREVTEREEAQRKARLADPVEDLKAHLAKALKAHKDGIAEVKQLGEDFPFEERRGKWRKAVWKCDDVDLQDAKKTDSLVKQYEAIVLCKGRYYYYPDCESKLDAEKCAAAIDSAGRMFRVHWVYKNSKWNIDAVDMWYDTSWLRLTGLSPMFELFKID